MARTVVPKYDGPVVVTVAEIRDAAQEILEEHRGDEDKADDIENVFYYEGAADALEGLLQWMTGSLFNRNTNSGDVTMAQKQTMDAIETTIDTTGETLQTLERIPKLALNGTTKKQQAIILGTVAGVSALSGVVLTVLAQKGKLRLRRKKNRKIIEDFAAGES